MTSDLSDVDRMTNTVAGRTEKRLLGDLKKRASPQLAQRKVNQGAAGGGGVTIAGGDGLRKVSVGDVVSSQADGADGGRQPGEVASQHVPAEVQLGEAGEVGDAGGQTAVQAPSLGGLRTTCGGELFARLRRTMSEMGEVNFVDIPGRMAS